LLKRTPLAIFDDCFFGGIRGLNRLSSPSFETEDDWTFWVEEGYEDYAEVFLQPTIVRSGKLALLADSAPGYVNCGAYQPIPWMFPFEASCWVWFPTPLRAGSRYLYVIEQERYIRAEIWICETPPPPAYQFWLEYYDGVHGPWDTLTITDINPKDFLNKWNQIKIWIEGNKVKATFAGYELSLDLTDEMMNFQSRFFDVEVSSWWKLF